MKRNYQEYCVHFKSVLDEEKPNIIRISSKTKER
jgi:hypothetical protein